MLVVLRAEFYPQIDKQAVDDSIFARMLVWL
jgi:hypothetical protein